MVTIRSLISSLRDNAGMKQRKFMNSSNINNPMKNKEDISMNIQKARQTAMHAAATLVLSAMLAPAVTLADTGHGHGNAAKGDKGHMMNQQEMGQHMREVTGVGRVNKVMSDKHMINISHEPISELNWPKMRMNFQTSDQVKLNDLKPGQEVTFTLQVDKDNNYLIKSIETK